MLNQYFKDFFIPNFNRYKAKHLDQLHTDMGTKLIAKALDSKNLYCDIFLKGPNK